MKTEGLDPPGAQSHEPTPRRPYRGPLVRSLGSVRELTLNMGTVQQTDIVTHQVGKTGS